MEKIKDRINVKILFIITCFCMAIPSCLYLLKGNSIANLTSSFSFFMKPSNEILTTQKIIQTILFMGLWIAVSIGYFYFIKRSEIVFKTWKSAIMMIVIVSILFMMILPMTSTDVFYYIGTGWSEAHYGMNPYYISVNDLMEESIEASQDEILLKMKGIWSDQTIVYGPIWPLVCKTLSYFSFGNLKMALLIYKLLNLLLHFASAYLVYRISKESKKATLMYALNPLILFEGLSNVHNEMLVIFFILLALYYLIRKKKIWLAIVFLAFATAVKYFAILLAPFFVLYYYQQEKLGKKIAYSFLLAILFLGVLVLCYSIYMKDLDVLKGIFVQQTKFANSIFTIVAVQNFKLAIQLSKGLMIAFVIIYAIEILQLLCSNKEHTWEEIMQKYGGLLLLFLFGTITNLQPWYVLWILPTIFWQKEKTQFILQAMTIIAILSTSIYFLWNESYIFGQYYMCIFAFFTILTFILQKQKCIKE